MLLAKIFILFMVGNYAFGFELDQSLPDPDATKIPVSPSTFSGHEKLLVRKKRFLGLIFRGYDELYFYYTWLSNSTFYRYNHYFCYIKLN